MQLGKLHRLNFLRSISFFPHRMTDLVVRVTPIYLGMERFIAAFMPTCVLQTDMPQEPHDMEGQIR